MTTSRLILAFLALSLAHPSAQAGGPTPWVAFDASFVRTEPGERRVVGWFHRAADGSTREESNANGTTKPVVLIMNVVTRLQYTLDNGIWSSNPLNLPPAGLRPDTVPRSPREFVRAKPIDTFDVVRFVNPQGIVLFEAPTLNYFPLSIERPNGGRERYSNVTIRDQPADLFLPPPDAKVLARPDAWRGPLWYPAGETPRR